MRCGRSAWPTTSASRRSREQLDIFISAARRRAEALDHVLLFGPPGLGKTTLAHIVAHEMGVDLRAHLAARPSSGRRPRRAAHQPRAARRAVHRRDPPALSPVVEEVLYPAMEDFQIDIMIGEGPAARSIQLDLPPFTLVGATTRTGLLTAPLRDRFGIVAAPRVLQRRGPGRRSCARSAPPPRRSPIEPTAPTRSPAARAARRASPTACCAACATSPQVHGDGRDHRGGRATRRCGCSRSTSSGSTTWTAAPADDHREVRRRPGRHRNARRRRRRGARHARGRVRAVPDPAGLPAAHAARARGGPRGLSPLRHHRPGRQRLRRTLLARLAAGRLSSCRVRCLL